MYFVHFEAGWGGVVWKTLGVTSNNVSSRYSAVNYNGTRVMGFNNIELISDRPLDLNLQEIAECIKLFPDRAMIVSLMADNTRESWHHLIAQVEDTGAHGLELNFGCPHGMTERGMGATVGQDPEIAKMVVEWVMEKATIPVITKLTPNVHSVVPTGRAVVEAGTDALSLINTIQSVTGVDLDTLVPNPYVAGQIGVWWLLRTGSKANCVKNAHNDCTGFLLRTKFLFQELVASALGETRLNLCCLDQQRCQVCTAAMKHGFRIVEDMCEGLNNWMDEKGFWYHQ
jgi:dihydropyrimidine dehydrogenase (NAD+) subunit PreA